MSTSRLLGVRPSAAPKTPFSTVRPARAVRVTASAQVNSPFTNGLGSPEMLNLVVKPDVLSSSIG